MCNLVWYFSIARFRESGWDTLLGVPEVCGARVLGVCLFCVCEFVGWVLPTKEEAAADTSGRGGWCGAVGLTEASYREVWCELWCESCGEVVSLNRGSAGRWLAGARLCGIMGRVLVRRIAARLCVFAGPPLGGRAESGRAVKGPDVTIRDRLAAAETLRSARAALYGGGRAMVPGESGART